MNKNYLQLNRLHENALIEKINKIDNEIKRVRLKHEQNHLDLNYFLKECRKTTGYLSKTPLPRPSTGFLLKKSYSPIRRQSAPPVLNTILTKQTIRRETLKQINNYELFKIQEIRFELEKTRFEINLKLAKFLDMKNLQ